MVKVKFRLTIITNVLIFSLMLSSGFCSHEQEIDPQKNNRMMVVYNKLKRTAENLKPHHQVTHYPIDHLNFDIKMLITGYLRPKQSMVMSEINKEFNLLTKKPLFWQQQLQNLGRLSYAHYKMKEYSPQFVVEQAILYQNVFLHVLKGDTPKAQSLLRRIDPDLCYVDFCEILDIHSVTYHIKESCSKSFAGKPQDGFISACRALNASCVYSYYDSLKDLVKDSEVSNCEILEHIYHYNRNNELLISVPHRQKISEQCDDLFTTLRAKLHHDLLKDEQDKLYEELKRSLNVENLNNFKSSSMDLLKNKNFNDSRIAVKIHFVMDTCKEIFTDNDFSDIDELFNAKVEKDPILKIWFTSFQILKKKKYDQALEILDDGLKTYPIDTSLMINRNEVLMKKIYEEASAHSHNPDYSPLVEFIKSRAELGNEFALETWYQLLTIENQFFKKDEIAAEMFLEQLIAHGNHKAIQIKLKLILNRHHISSNQNDLIESKNLIEMYRANPPIKLLKIFGMLLGQLGYTQDFDEAVNIIREEEIMPYILDIRPTFNKSPVPSGSH